MPISKDYRSLTKAEKAAWIALRRDIRESFEYKARKRPPSDVSVANLARDLGMERHELARRVAEALPLIKKSGSVSK